MDLYTVGPVNMFEETLKEYSKQIPYFRNDEFSKTVLHINDMARKLYDAKEECEVVLLTTSGSGAMEASVASLCGQTNKALVINGGTNGKRFADLCERYQVNNEVLKLDFALDLTEELLKPYENKGIDTVFINLCETSVGKFYNPKVIGNFAKKIGAVLIVDAVSAFLADDFSMKDMGANLIFTGSQKAMALDAGLCLCCFDEIAKKRMEEVGYRGAYLNLLEYVKDSHRGQTPFTPAIATILAMEKRMDLIFEKGGKLSETNRCKEFAEYFREQIKGLPLTIPNYNLSNSCTALICEKEDAQQLRAYLVENYDIHITPSGGDMSNKLIRVGHIGKHTKGQYDLLVNGIKEFYNK